MPNHCHNTPMTYQIISERKLKRKVKIRSPAEAYGAAKRYASAKQEYFILLTLNGARNIISVSIVTIGLANKAFVHAREIFCRAISDNATEIIICHNHPSGEVMPSNEDMQLTKDIYLAGKIIGIPLVDHIIISKKGFMSMRDKGFFPENELLTAA